MTLGRDGARLRVSVRDDGVGFEPGGPTEGFGLIGMRERAELLGGRLHLESAPGAGTTVTATFPIRERRPERVAVPRSVAG